MLDLSTLRNFVLPGIVTFALAACGEQAAEAPQQPAAIDNPRDFSGVWWNGPSDTPYTLEIVGDAPALTPAGEAKYVETKALKASLDAAENDPNNVTKCVLVGVPRIWAQPYPFEIAVRPEQVTIVYEQMHSFRLIYMDRPPVTLENAIGLNRYGNSVGRWDGDTLVIDSNAFADTPVLDETGLPLTEELRTQERIRKLDNDTLEVVTTVEDPQYYVKPWVVRATFKRQGSDVRIQEYTCGYGVFETRYRPAQ